MKQYGNKLLPSVGKIFKSNGILSFSIPVNVEYEELDINTDNIEIFGNIAFVDKKFAVKIDGNPIKGNLIHKLFSNDDQIAIILNKEKSIMTFMNEWRDFFGSIAHKINDMINE